MTAPVGLLGTLIERCNSYLGNGGFFNPEMMDHQKVGQLLLDVRDFLVALPPAPPQAQEPSYQLMRDGRLIPCTALEFDDWLRKAAEACATRSDSSANIIHLASAAFGTLLAASPPAQARSLCYCDMCIHAREQIQAARKIAKQPTD